ncbi:hypothetical protein PG984_003126 [Apiospora sp. TS-2023a]
MRESGDPEEYVVESDAGAAAYPLAITAKKQGRFPDQIAKGLIVKCDDAHLSEGIAGPTRPFQFLKNPKNNVLGAITQTAPERTNR